MEKDYSYSSQVNRRLASTHFLITSYQQHQKKSLTRLEKQAYIDSILLQLYCGCHSYCNELLSHHRQSTLNSDSFNLTALFTEKKYEGVSEFNELGVLYDQKNNGLFQLCKLFEDLVSVGSKEEQEKNRKRDEIQISTIDSSLESSLQKINLVAIDVVNIDVINIDVVNIDDNIDTLIIGSSDVDLSDVEIIKTLLRTLQELIDRQREYLLEY